MPTSMQSVLFLGLGRLGLRELSNAEFLKLVFL